MIYILIWLSIGFLHLLEGFIEQKIWGKSMPADVSFWLFIVLGGPILVVMHVLDLPR